MNFERKLLCALIGTGFAVTAGAQTSAGGNAASPNANGANGGTRLVAAVNQRATTQVAAAPAAAVPVAADAGVAGGVGTATAAELGPQMALVVGKSTLVRLNAPISRISVGNPAIADVTLINNRELYLLGKNFGSTNVMMWRRDGSATIIDVNVNADAGALQQRMASLLPNEKGIVVEAAADSIVLSGSVSSASAADSAVQIAESFGRAYSRGINLPVKTGNAVADQGQTMQVQQASANRGGGEDGPRVVNLMQVLQPQQVMLEVKVAEISKTLLDKLGGGINASRTNGSWTYGILSNLLTDSSGVLSAVKSTGNRFLIDAEKRDGLVKILAEPNIVAISGQEASFLAGGKIFIPVAKTNGALGVPTITLEEKEFGVGLKFMPTVLGNGRINLKVAPEVSELAQAGSPFTSIDGTTSILPSFTTRRAQTTVQLGDGQSFAIAGLIKNNVTSTVKRFPILGEVPILGALFRSTEFQSDQTELMFIITPRLVNPSNEAFVTPTDYFKPASRPEQYGTGQQEGSGRVDVPADRPARPKAAASADAGSATGGYLLN